MRVSVIIPTRNRAKLLNKCLAKLLPQVDQKDEVIVVDNASRDITKKIVSSYKEKSPIKYLFEPSIGPSFARNLGISKAKGEILAFLDDDCMVASDWLGQIKTICENEQKKSRHYVYQGKIRHYFLKQNLLSKIFFQQNKLRFQQIKKSRAWRTGKYINYLNTGFFFLNKSVLDGLDYVFDTKTFPFVGEERDLAYRLQLAGYSIIYTPQVKVVHIKEEPTLPKSFKTAFRYGRAQGILEQRYQVRSEIKTVFNKKLEHSQARNGKLSEIYTVANHLKKHRMLDFYKILFYLSLREAFFLFGEIYGKVVFKILPL
jgi:glycosyltransferase involved in cell wall biosynthesis